MREKGHRTLWLALRKEAGSPETGWKLGGGGEGVASVLTRLGILSSPI